jgi:hypothetical protein
MKTKNMADATKKKVDPLLILELAHEQSRMSTGGAFVWLTASAVDALPQIRWPFGQ